MIINGENTKKELKGLTMKHFTAFLLSIAVIFFSLPVYAQTDITQQEIDTQRLNGGPILLGIGLLLAPLATETKGLDVGHSWEIEGFSYASTDVLERVFPKKFWFMAPIFTALGDLAYRACETNASNRDVETRKFIMDLTGIAGRITFNF